MTEDDYLPPPSMRLTLSPATAAGLSGLVIGCTLLISASVLMVFNVILFRSGLAGIPRDLAQVGGLIGTIGVAILGFFSLGLGAKSWGSARGSRESSVLGAAATVTAAVGLVGWLIAGIDLMMILLD